MAESFLLSSFNREDLLIAIKEKQEYFGAFVSASAEEIDNMEGFYTLLKDKSLNCRPVFLMRPRNFFPNSIEEDKVEQVTVTLLLEGIKKWFCNENEQLG